MKLRFSFLPSLLLACSLHAAELPANTLPDSVRDALHNAKIPLTSVGIVVQDLNAAAPLLEVNAHQAMNPASTIKLLTTFAALEILGPAYTWRTEAWLDGKLENGILDGNLIIKGYGNPKFTAEHLWSWLHEMKNRGLREIRGNVILDHSAFAPQQEDPAAFDNSPDSPYNVVPDALLLNFNAIRFHFSPAADHVDIYSEPPLNAIALDNQVKLQRGPHCGDWEDRLHFKLLDGGHLVRISGKYAAICGERNQALSLLPHTAYFDATFRTVWKEIGGAFYGSVVEGTVTPSAMLFSAQYSQPLSEIIRDINKFSNNVMARQVFLTLSLEQAAFTKNIPEIMPDPASGVPASNLQPASASVEASITVLKNWLTQKGLDLPDLVLENGAGLSRNERISPASMALLLREIELSPYSAEIEASLPIVGIDGTMRRRHNDCEVKAHAHMKTGSLEGVKSMAGFIQSRSGKQWLVVFIINHPHAARGGKAQDELLDWLQQNG